MAILNRPDIKARFDRQGLDVLTSTPEELKALSAKVAQEGIILTDDQVRALEKTKLEKDAHGEIETEHPGYLGSQDTYYVGNLKGGGRI